MNGKNDDGRGRGWRSVGDLFPTDEQGRRIIGNPKVGCQHCGLVVRSRVEDHPHIIVYHPGAECCAAAVLDRIDGVNDTIRSLQAQIDRDGVLKPGIKDRVFDDLKERSRLQARLRELEHNE